MSSKITTHYNVDPIATSLDIENTFMHHPPFGDQPERYNLIRENAKAFAYLIVSLVPKSTERERALSHLDEAVASANQAIARHERPEPPIPIKEVVETLKASKFAGCYGGHDPNELPLDDSEQAGGDPTLRRARERNVIPA